MKLPLKLLGDIYMLDERGGMAGAQTIAYWSEIATIIRIDNVATTTVRYATQATLTTIRIHSVVIYYLCEVPNHPPFNSINDVT